MRILLSILLLAIFSEVWAATIPEPEPEGLLEDGWINHYSLGVGLRTLDDDDWAGLDSLLAIDLDADVRPVGWWLAPAFGIHSGWGSAEDDSGREFDLRVFEFALGARKWFDAGPIAANLGLFGTLSSARLESERFDDNHTAWGAAGEGGLFYVFGDALFLGVRGRYAVTEEMDFNLAADAGDLNGLTLTGVIGGRF